MTFNMYYPQPGTAPWPVYIPYETPEYVIPVFIPVIWSSCPSCGASIRVDYGYMYCPFCGKPLYDTTAVDRDSPSVTGKEKDKCVLIMKELEKLDEINKKLDRLL